MTDTVWRAIAVDDEPPALKRLAALLAEVPGVRLVGTYDDPREAVPAIERERPDLLFLDIQMPEMTGFELVAALGDECPLVIFVTAYDEHAIRAFEVNALDYLLKPVQRERLAATLARARERLSTRSASEIQAQLHAVLRGTGAGAPARVAVRTGTRVLLVDPATIDRVEADGNTLTLHAGRERVEFRETLTAFEARLPPARFVRVSRSTVVNLASVRQVEPWFNGDYVLILADGAKVTTGRTYRDRVRAALGLA
ncbi:MAG TPA: LytTR family DNA-binding domain-containing protein [Longimicrobium sp.]|jgi:two-component system LytT family response regulator|uniref:LytR/AlgR family response regulator transcription factor n=1 Tax=Longimicrobium sp. TaxID=2029185 RepID=UPI002ED90FAD